VPSGKPQNFATVITPQKSIELMTQTFVVWRHARLM